MRAQCQGVITEPSEGAGAAQNGSTGSGSGATGSGGSTGTPSEACTNAADASRSVLRRLTKLEFQLTLQELFRLDAPPDVSGVPEDSDQGRAFAPSPRSRTSPTNTCALPRSRDGTRERVARRSGAARGGHRLRARERRLPRLLRSIVRQARRLPARSRGRRGERPRDASHRARALDVEDEYRFVIESLLSSPSFVFRVEVGAGDALATLTSAELASRLLVHPRGQQSPAPRCSNARPTASSTTRRASRTVADELLADERAADFFRCSSSSGWTSTSSGRRRNRLPGWSDALSRDDQPRPEQLLDEFAWGPSAACRRC